MFEKPALWASPLGGGPCCHGQRRDSRHSKYLHFTLLQMWLLSGRAAGLALRPFQIQCLKGVCRNSSGFSSWLTFKGEHFLLGLQGGRYLIKQR